MAAEIPVDLFLDLLRQSGLLVDAQMLALMAEFSGGGKRQENSRVLADELIKRGVLTDWQADNLLQGKHKGFRLGPYRILRPLGQGGMSKVFLGEHMLMHRRCAIKVLPTKYQEDPDLLSRFHLEARAIAALDHPHIVRAYDFNKDVKDARSGKEIHYLVMEYVEGMDLRRMVEEQGPLDYRKAADFMSQAAEGLAHAHSVGLVHRDVKPANLLVDPNGVLKILDLGLARVTFEGEEAWQTSEGEQSAVGTADYVAPEQVVDSRTADGRADLYSLGYTFYYLLTGRRPFPKSTLVELLMAHRVESPEPISKVRPDVPPELVQIIEWMTAKTPALRPQKANEVVEKLQAWLHASEGGREYSRISALMAAAMRAKQPDSETTPSKPESAENADLELAIIDEEPKTPPPAKAPASHAPENAKPIPPETKDRPRTLKPSESGRTATLSREQADLLLEFVPPSQEQIQPVVSPQYKHKRPDDSGNILKSPWLWIGLAVVVLLSLVLVFVFSPPPTERSEPTTNREPAASNSDDQSTIPSPPSTTKAAPEPAANAPIVNETPTQKPKAEPNVKPPKPKSTKKIKPPKGPKVKPPADAQQPPSPDVKPSPDAKTTPETPENPSPPPSVPVSPEAKDKAAALAQLSADLLAGLSTVTLRFMNADALNMIVERQAKDAVDRIRQVDKIQIEVTKDSTNVLELELRTVDVNEASTMTLSAKLQCQAPDGSVVTVWKHTKPVVTFDKRRGHPDPAGIKKLLRNEAIDFFKQFREDVRQARSKAKPK